MVLTSPLKIATDKEWKECVEDAIQLESLIFKFVEEVCLLVPHALSFHKEFSAPPVPLFSHVMGPGNPSRVRIPVMLVTVAYACQMRLQMQQPSG